MSKTGVAVVLAHGGWADGSSWTKVIAALRSEGVTAVAAPLPLTLEQALLAATQRPLAAASIGVRPGRTGPAGSSWPKRIA